MGSASQSQIQRMGLQFGSNQRPNKLDPTMKDIDNHKKSRPLGDRERQYLGVVG